MATEAPPEPGSEPDADLLNLKQVARILDVHYMTAYRYVRHGRLPARQEGTGWLVERADVDAFRSGPAATSEGVDWAGRLVGPLTAGDEVAAWAVVNDALNSGVAFDALHLEVLGRAVASVEGGPTALEHRLAVNTAGRLVARLGGKVPHRGRKLGTVVLAAPAGEHHGLALAIVANLVRRGGFRVLELGTDVSVDDVLAAVGHVDDPIALGISVTTASCLDAAMALVDVIRSTHPSLPVLLGGQAVASPEVAAVAGATAWSFGPELVTTLHGLAADRRAPTSSPS
jgi:excisionase family DNA binding protein